MKSSLFMTDMIKHFRDSTKNSVHNVTTSRPATKTHQSIVRHLGVRQTHIGRQCDTSACSKHTSVDSATPRRAANTYQSTVRHLGVWQTHVSRQCDTSACGKHTSVDSATPRRAANTHQSTVRHLGVRQTHISRQCDTSACGKHTSVDSATIFQPLASNKSVGKDDISACGKQHVGQMGYRSSNGKKEKAIHSGPIEIQ